MELLMYLESLITDFGQNFLSQLLVDLLVPLLTGGGLYIVCHVLRMKEKKKNNEPLTPETPQDKIKKGNGAIWSLFLAFSVLFTIATWRGCNDLEKIDRSEKQYKTCDSCYQSCLKDLHLKNDTIRILKDSISKLNSDIGHKNNTIKMQEMRLADKDSLIAYLGRYIQNLERINIRQTAAAQREIQNIISNAEEKITNAIGQRDSIAAVLTASNDEIKKMKQEKRILEEDMQNKILGHVSVSNVIIVFRDDNRNSRRVTLNNWTQTDITFSIITDNTLSAVGKEIGIRIKGLETGNYLPLNEGNIGFNTVELTRIFTQNPMEMQFISRINEQRPRVDRNYRIEIYFEGVLLNTGNIEQLILRFN